MKVHEQNTSLILIGVRDGKAIVMHSITLRLYNLRIKYNQIIINNQVLKMHEFI